MSVKDPLSNVYPLLVLDSKSPVCLLIGLHQLLLHSFPLDGYTTEWPILILCSLRIKSQCYYIDSDSTFKEHMSPVLSIAFYFLMNIS